MPFFTLMPHNSLLSLTNRFRPLLDGWWQVLAGEGGLVVSNPALALPVFHVQAQSSNAFDSASGGAEDDPISGSSSSLHGYPTMGQVAGAQRLVPLTTGWIV